jgi:L-rhamnose mutarotase
MERRAFLLRLKPEYTEQYIEAHRNVWPELLERYRKAGIKRLSVFALESMLFLYLEADNFESTDAALAGDEVEIKWQQFMHPMFEPDSEQSLVEVFHLS